MGAPTTAPLKARELTTGKQGVVNTLIVPDGSITSSGLSLTGGSTANYGNTVYPGLFPNASYPSGATKNLAAGWNDIGGVVPANRKRLVYDYFVTNQTAGSILHRPGVKISGTYYYLGGSLTEPTSGVGHNYGMGPTKFSNPIVLNAGESFAVNTDVLGLEVVLVTVEFDATSPISRASITNWIVGDNVLLTVDSGKTVFTGSVSPSNANNNPTPLIQSFAYYNFTGGSATISAINYVIPVVGTIQMAAPGTVLTGNGFVKYLPGNLPSGSQIVIPNTSATAGQIAWLNYVSV